MQTMAYSGYQGPQQQQQTATPVPVIFFADSVTPMIPGWERSRYHSVRDDFKVITPDVTGAADCLRYFETQTNQRIKTLRKHHGITDGFAPDDDDLWITATFEDISRGTLGTWSASTYWRAMPSLLGKEFLRRRFIARRDASTSTSMPAAPIYKDDKGFFIIVDQDGDYVDRKGELHNAVEEGYILEWQYLFCFEKVNAALAEAAWQAPPEPMKRWPRIVKRRDLQKEREANGVSANIRQDPTDTASQEFAPSIAPHGGTKMTAVDEALSLFQNTTIPHVESTIRHDFLTNLPIDPASEPVIDLREAPWSPETLIGLASARLAVPEREDCGEETWQTEWAEPAAQIIEITASIAPNLAWERIERVIAGMIEGPTWYATGRARKTPFTLKHVAKNWTTVMAELDNAVWYPSTATHYNGPAWSVDEPIDAVAASDDSYATGYEVSMSVVEENVAPEPPPYIPRTLGMIRSYAERLAEKILCEHPRLCVRIEERSPRHYFVCIEYAPGAWLDIASPGEWNRPTQETKQLLVQAVQAADGVVAQEVFNEEGGDGNDGAMASDAPWHDAGRARNADNRDDVGVPRDYLRLQEP